MRMSQKMILLFSVLFLTTTIVSTIYNVNLLMDDLEKTTYTDLHILGSSIVDASEQYIQQMNFSIHSLSSNTEFMDALYRITSLEDIDDLSIQLSTQNHITRALYKVPIRQPFYRISLYNEDGFYISSRLEQTDSVISLSEETRNLIEGLPYLSAVDQAPFELHILIHDDPFTQNRTVPVFSIVRCLSWLGERICYIEVSAEISELLSIFIEGQYDGIQACGVFSDGRTFYRGADDTAVYEDIPLNTLQRVKCPDGSERFVVCQYSEALDLFVYVSRDASLFFGQAASVIKDHILPILFIFLATVIITVLISLSLTRSVNKLTKKIKLLQTDSLIAHDDPSLNEMVTSAYDLEINQLETVFNNLMKRLRLSFDNEMMMRKSTLQAELSALQLQINPHFVYNTLNIIASKGMECGSEEIAEICDQFAQMLRYATDLRSTTATLSDEIQNAQRYLMLAKSRYEDKLDYAIDIPAEIRSFSVPKLTLQPIVENALTHGFNGRKDQRMIQLIGFAEDKMLKLMIRDNGNGFREEMLWQLQEAFHQIESGTYANTTVSGDHLGLINTYLRLHHYSKGTMRMQLHNDHGAVITITLPQEENHV